jgi:hypothetical protein
MRFAYTALTLCLLAQPLFAADNPFLGTWELNVAKSTYSPGPAPKEVNVKFEQDGDKIHRIATGTNGDGSAINEDSRIPWDGKDHLVTQPPAPPITAAVTWVNARTLHVVLKQNGKITDTLHVVISKDGKTVTDTDDGVNAKGEKVHNVEITEKQ